jgi:hypothetical protein
MFSGWRKATERQGALRFFLTDNTASVMLFFNRTARRIQPLSARLPDFVGLMQDQLRLFETTMNPEQQSSGPLPTQSDPDSSQSDAEPGQRSLSKTAPGSLAVKTIAGDANRRQQVKVNCRFARPVYDQHIGGADSMRMNDNHRWSLAP